MSESVQEQKQEQKRNWRQVPGLKDAGARLQALVQKARLSEHWSRVEDWAGDVSARRARTIGKVETMGRQQVVAVAAGLRRVADRLETAVRPATGHEGSSLH